MENPKEFGKRGRHPPVVHVREPDPAPQNGDPIDMREPETTPPTTMNRALSVIIPARCLVDQEFGKRGRQLSVVHIREPDPTPQSGSPIDFRAPESTPLTSLNRTLSLIAPVLNRTLSLIAPVLCLAGYIMFFAGAVKVSASRPNCADPQAAQSKSCAATDDGQRGGSGGRTRFSLFNIGGDGAHGSGSPREAAYGAGSRSNAGGVNSVSYGGFGKAGGAYGAAS